jgi:hypothetical protein
MRLDRSKPHGEALQRGLTGLLVFDSDISDERAHLALNRLQISVDFGWLSFDEHLNTAIGKVADIPNELESAS